MESYKGIFQQSPSAMSKSPSPGFSGVGSTGRLRHSLRAKLKDLQRSEHELQEPGTCCCFFFVLKSGKYLEEFGGKQGVIHVVCVLFCFVSLPIFCVLDVGSSKFGGNFVKSGSHFGIMTLPISDGSNNAKMW